MPYDGDQFFSTAQRLASTCTHGRETKWGEAHVKKGRTQTGRSGGTEDDHTIP